MILKETEELYLKACEAYYNGKPFMTDAEFDVLQAQIRKDDPNNKILKGVGAATQVTVWPVVKHQILMGSTFKVNNAVDLTAWGMKYTAAKKLCWSEKLDGSSIELVYSKGKFIQAVTRGDGLEGEDITINALLMEFPKEIENLSSNLIIRGEILLMVEDLNKHFEGECNPRNSAAGTSRRKHDNEKCKHLKIFVYDYTDLDPFVCRTETKSQKFQILESLGFTVPMWGITTLADAMAIISKYEKIKGSLGYWIDGLIFEEDNLAFFEAQGVSDNRPRAMRAYKFEDEQVKTIVTDIIRQTGKTGVITPVALITPTELGGTTISRVSLMNYAEIRKLGVDVGSTAILVKCNQIIPRIIGVEERASHVPNVKCPSCDTEAVWDGIDEADGKPIRQICPNKNCPAQVISRIVGYLSVLDVKGFGDKLVEKLSDAGKLDTFADLYKLTPNDFAELDGCGEKVGIKIVNQIQNKKNIELPTFIKAISIKGFASSFTTLVMGKLPTLEAMRSAKLEDLEGIKGIGQAIAEAMVTGLKESSQTIDELLKCITIKYEAPQEIVVSEDAKAKGLSFVFTGVRSKEGEEKIVKNGGKVAGDISKNVTHLVCKDKLSKSSKMQKAASLGITIMDLEEFNAVIKEW